MKNKSYIGIMVLTLCGLGAVRTHAQVIDCSVQQDYVNSLNQKLTDINRDLAKAQDQLSACANVQTTVSSDVYQQTKQAIAAQQVNTTPPLDIQGTLKGIQ